MNYINGENCYVAFIDILGFKSLVNKNDIMYIKSVFDDLAKTRKDIFDEHNILDIDSEFAEMIKFVYVRFMSDSIIIAIPSRFRDSLSFIGDWCRRMQCNLLEKQVICRGAISIGEFYGDEEIMFGKGLVKAYSLESNHAIYPRIVLSGSVIKDYLYKVKTTSIIYITDFILQDIDDWFYIDYKMWIGDNDNPMHDVSEFIENTLFREDLSLNIRDKYLWLKKYWSLDDDEQMRNKSMVEKLFTNF